MSNDEKKFSSRKYVLIMPARDEENYIPQTLDCIANQSILPAECIVVDDGSFDRTGEIAETYAKKFPWINVIHLSNRGERKVGGGVISAFYAGYKALRTTDYNYICKIDADVTFPLNYFENIMKKMEENPKLGGASGKGFNPVNNKLYEERIIDEMVAGQVNFWRRECWEMIGRFVQEVMWDGIVFHRARMFGWKTKSFSDDNLRIVHHRLMGSSHKSVFHGRLRWGQGQWFMGTHPLYIIASGIFRMQERPYIIGGFLIIAGYFIGMIKGLPCYNDLKFRKNLHRWQLKRLGLGWLAPEE